MQCRETVQPDHPIELAKGFPNRGFVADVVTGGEDVRGIETNAEPFRFTHVGDDGGEMLEAIAETRALAGRGLERDSGFDFRQAGEDLIERANYFREARGLSRAEMRSGMHEKKRHLELVRADEFFRRRAI